MLSVNWGTVIWTTIAFLSVLFLLKKMAWGPILQSLKERTESIENALLSAERAKEEMSKLQSSNEQLLREARAERDGMLKDARDAKDKMISEAKSKAKEEGDRIIQSARETIKNEKMAAIQELKSQVGVLSIEIAEKIVKEKLSNDERQKELVSNLLKEVKLS
jgi:F-type H+-transporting ATPase subunit b